MPQLNLNVAHQLSVEEATERIKKRLHDDMEKHADFVKEPKNDWVSDNKAEFSFKAYGFAVSGNVQSLPGSVDVSLSLPFAAIMLKNRIESEIKSGLEQLLS
ncbi:MAG: polyhydroxyalkanoic acid system family protein [Thermoguttaceae bacterium]